MVTWRQPSSKTNAMASGRNKAPLSSSKESTTESRKVVMIWAWKTARTHSRKCHSSALQTLVANYLQGRLTFVDFRGAWDSSTCIWEANWNSTAYRALSVRGNDWTILIFCNNIPQMSQKLKNYLQSVVRWIREQYLEEPLVTMFTLFTIMKMLGITFDSKQHSRNAKDKIQSRNNVLKALVGSKWGNK